VPYTGGNGGTHNGQTVTSTGVTGLTATLPAGTFANGSGSLTYTISGTPASSGTASFALSIGGQTCTLTRTVSNLDCSAPVISSTNSTQISSTVTWNAVTGAQEYRLRYRIGSCTLPNNNPWIDSITIDGSFTQYTINGLNSGTNYECQIKSRCSITPSVFSSYSALATISTGSPVNTVSSLNCASAFVNGTVNINQQVTGVTIVVPYTGGNNTFYSYEIVNSTGVTGLVATRDQGTLNWCGGVVTYYISGMATSCGQANFAINLGGQTCTISLLVKCCPDIVTDIDGNVYQVVQINDQCWTKENLRTTRYNNGSVIPNVTSDDAWINLSSPAWCNYNNSPANDAVYGKLYNWYTVAAGNLCPTGWHVPTDAEWTTLTSFLGGEIVAGGKMKSTTGWNAPNTAATNESGFSGLPGGYRTIGYGHFASVGGTGSWWSSTESSTTGAWVRYLSYDDGNAIRLGSTKRYGFSVRCLRD
jgi:uncharacterized protein (TIGR02145 family)